MASGSSARKGRLKQAKRLKDKRITRLIDAELGFTGLITPLVTEKKGACTPLKKGRAKAGQTNEKDT